jgi:hypothetical protein
VSYINTIFSQLKRFVPEHQFNYLVESHKGNYRTKHFTCTSQFNSLLYAQITGKDSLRDIETSLRSQESKLYHLGIKKISRTTLADANERINYQIYEKLFYKILQRCQSLSKKHTFRFKNELYSLDSTTIDLCLAIFPWAKFRTTKGAIKLHTLLNHSGYLPEFIQITDGKCHDTTAAKNIKLPPDSILSIDRAYIDFKWLYSLHSSGVYFVTRKKDNMDYTYVGQHKGIQNPHIKLDRAIQLNGHYSAQNYPENLRLVRYCDPETGEILEFITNIFHLSALTIAAIYRSRWQIELFFKWIKQNLKIKTFFGTSKNAVMTQVWIAMIYYLLLAYVKFQTKYSQSLLTLSRIIRETILDHLDLIDLLRLKPRASPDNLQLQLF